jgi:hypothetical protein
MVTTIINQGRMEKGAGLVKCPANLFSATA